MKAQSKVDFPKNPSLLRQNSTKSFKEEFPVRKLTIIKTDVYKETNENEPDEIVLPMGPPNLLKLSLEHF